MTNAQIQALLEKLTALEAHFLDYARAVRTRLSGNEVPDVLHRFRTPTKRSCEKFPKW
jgi:hypothetical protein